MCTMHDSLLECIIPRCTVHGGNEPLEATQGIVEIKCTNVQNAWLIVEVHCTKVYGSWPMCTTGSDTMHSRNVMY